MNGMMILFACIGAIALYLVGVALISWIFTSIIQTTDGVPDDFDYAMTAVILQASINIMLICYKVIDVLGVLK